MTSSLHTGKNIYKNILKKDIFVNFLSLCYFTKPCDRAARCKSLGPGISFEQICLVSNRTEVLNLK